MENQAPPPYNYYPNEGQHVPMPMTMPVMNPYAQQSSAPGIPMPMPIMKPYAGYPSAPVDLNATAPISPVVTPLDTNPTRMICPHCRATIDTIVEKNPSTTAWISSLLLCLTVGYCGCCLIPFCMDDCHDVKHTCPNCQAFLGERRA